jgi:hypothetical protein
VIVNGRVVYGKAGWITSQYPGSCAICGDAFDEGAKVIRVSAKPSGGNWAAECCARDAVILSGHPALRQRLAEQDGCDPEALAVSWRR